MGVSCGAPTQAGHAGGDNLGGYCKGSLQGKAPAGRGLGWECCLIPVEPEEWLEGGHEGGTHVPIGPSPLTSISSCS